MDAHLQSHFDALEREKTAFMAELERHSRTQLEYQPAPGAWNMIEVVQHLVLVEQAMLRSFDAARATSVTWRSRLVLGLVLFVLRRVRRVQTVPAAIPRERRSFEAVQDEWNAARAQLRDQIEGLGPDALLRPVFLQPVAGPVTADQGLEFLRVHLEHHRPQLERIRSTPGFPSA